MLGGADPVGVDGLDVPRVRLPLPAGHETCCHSGAFVDDALRHRGLVDTAGRLRDERQRRHRRLGQLVAGGVVVDVEQRLETPHRGQRGQRGLDVDTDVARVHVQWEGLGGRQAPAELAVHQQRPDVTERDAVAHQILDVDAAVAQGAAVLVRFGDLGREGHDTFEACDEVLGDLRRRH
ncbi:Uncharacterised protein [Mycobacteroides abscessus subsp. abscessus]|nr:Uncharacterised protein [Mycobacteroides abscessus subsp. abscessus]